MEEKKFITSLGYILKKEKLASLASEKHYTELILEDLDPFPGFYDHYFIPANENEKKPRSIFIILKEMELCNENNFIRLTMKLKRQQTIKFDAAMGYLHLFNQPTACIRVFMDDYNQLPAIIDFYHKAGMKFQPHKEIKPFQSLIEVRKYFEMEVIAEGIYKDTEQPDTYYFPVSKYVSWHDFEHMTSIIRNNMDHKLYDAAQAAIYQKAGLLDLVRIYDKKATPESLRMLSNKYAAEIARI